MFPYFIWDLFTSLKKLSYFILLVTDSQANIDRRDLRKKRRENRLHKNKNRIHSALILPLKSHNKPQKAGYPRQQQEQKRQDFIETSSAEDISVCRLKSYLLDQNSTFLTTLNRPSTSCTESNMSRVPTSTKLLKKRQSSASSKVFDGLYSQGEEHPPPLSFFLYSTLNKALCYFYYLAYFHLEYQLVFCSQDCCKPISLLNKEIKHCCSNLCVY